MSEALITPPIEIRGLTKRYLRHVAVDALDLTVSNGSAFALLGRNGAGKSTLIRILMDLVRATKGRCASLGGGPRTSEKAAKRASAMWLMGRIFRFG